MGPRDPRGEPADAATGSAGIVNAGHPFPLRLRDGRVEEIDLRIEPPFGVVPGKSFDVQRFPLEPGDRIVLLTDGMQERNAVDLDVASALAASADLHPREVVLDAGGSAFSVEPILTQSAWFRARSPAVYSPAPSSSSPSPNSPS